MTPHHFANRPKNKIGTFKIFAFRIVKSGSFQSGGGFTLTELLVTIVILTLIIGAIYAAYLLNQRAVREGERAAEITQNGRVILERMVREIRQAKEIVPPFPETETEATSTILFEDGHETAVIRYIHYYLDNEEKVWREVIAYYFATDPGTCVRWNAGESLESQVLEEPRIIGELVSNLKLWGLETINISLNLKKQEKEMNLNTKVFGRNL